MNVPSILIVDPSLEFLKLFEAFEKTGAVRAHVAGTGAAAQLFLADDQYPLLGAFINPWITRPNGISVIRACRAHRPVMPIYLLSEGTLPDFLGPEAIKQLGIREVIQKPISFEQMIKVVAPLSVVFNPEEALTQSAANTDEQGKELDLLDASFTKISAVNFLTSGKSLFDVYVKIRAGRYLMILRAGEAFTSDRLSGYLNSGTVHFYIKRDVHETYLKYCDYLDSFLLDKKSISPQLKISQTLNLGQETYSFLTQSGVSEVNIGYAKKFVNNLSDLVGQLHSTDENLKVFIENVENLDHGVGTAAIAGILANQLNVTFDRPLQTIGLASLFHDIGLLTLPEFFHDEDESKMNPEQMKLYETHPQKSIEILSKIVDLDRAAIQGIAQHHLRAGNKGFPKQKTWGGMSWVGEIVGICDEYNRIILNSKKNPNFNVGQYFEEKCFPKFSKQITDVFRSTFLEHS